MSGHPQPLYLPTSGATATFRAPTSNHNREQGQELDLKPNNLHQSQDDIVIEPSLANMSPQEAYSGELSQAEEQVFQLQLQAAAAVNDESMVPSTEQLTQDHANRQRRLGRACDACSKRKVKCGDEIPCKNCMDLGVPCTFIRPAKRRGPANKVAEDLKRARFEVNDLNTPPNTGAPAPGMPYLSLDSIAPFETIHRLLYDFFTYLYPIFPFPHEHLIMERLRKREDTQNKSFCALVAALIAALSATFPRIAEKALGQYEQDSHTVTNEAFISRALLICEQSRVPLTSGLDVDDAATVFFVGLVSHLRKQPRQPELFMTEALNIVQFLGVERAGALADRSPADLVTQEVCRRIYWAVYSFSNSLQLSKETQMIMPVRKTSELPPLPLETDDYYIYVDRIQQQPQGQLSTLEGFSILTRIHSLCHPLLKFDMMDDEDRQLESIKVLEISAITNMLQQLDTVLLSGHPELSSTPNSSVFEGDDSVPSQQARMHIRWEIQKIILRSTLITTKYHLAERLAVVQGSDEGPVQDLRKKCMFELSELAGHVTRTSLEPVAKLVVPGLDVVLQALRGLPAGIDVEQRDMYLTERFAELFDGW